MVSINKSVEANSSVERIWEIVSDLDRDSEYWKGMNSISNVEKKGNVVERDVRVGFMGHDGHQIITLNPKQSTELTMAKGPLKGSRIIKLVPLGQNRTRLDVAWDFQFSGVPVFARDFVKLQLEEVTQGALEKITKTAEQALTASQ